FRSADWADALRGSVGAPVLCFDPAARDGTAYTVFRAALFRIAYVNYPRWRVGEAELLGEAAARAALGALREIGVDVVNGPLDWVPPACRRGARVDTLIETSIDDLPAWSPQADAELRRVARRVAKSGVEVVPATRGHARFAYERYRATMARHGGSAKYPLAYFEAVLDLAARADPVLRARVALVGGELAAYLITGADDGTMHYLHGGLRLDLSSAHPTDALFLDSIAAARDAGYRRYDFMASPADQPQLVRFKEKWGGTTRRREVASIPLRPLRARAFAAAKSAHAWLTRMRARASMKR
ncbi:MAG TPA: GNAT family N-acetyltransferase, partial [Xanthomonadales bacterium]|nr:GNAT family N-acetyltransferase [Xanthomonadales bacterium]